MKLNQLYINGSHEAITKVVDFIKENNLIDADKLDLVDLRPTLSEEYMDEHLLRGRV